jgi:DNA repair protein RecN (Recombination protein N)
MSVSPNGWSTNFTFPFAAFATLPRSRDAAASKANLRSVLEELRIRGLGVIDDATLPLGPGLTVVTGETGAGKTMVVTGLLLLFGGRAESAQVRTGADQASVDGQLQVSDAVAAARVQQAGGALDDGTGLVLRRIVNATGRSRAFVGGAAAPVALLGELALRLLTVHGQADQLRLTRRSDQLGALDRFGDLDLAPYRSAYEQWRVASDALSQRLAKSGQLRREADLLAHGIAEIEAVQPLSGEDVELGALAQRLAHADGLRLAARAAHDALAGDADDPASELPDVGVLLGRARQALEQQSLADADLDALAVRVTELSALAADLAADLRDYTDQLDADPARLAQIEERRGVLRGLIRKYGDAQADVAAVLDWAEQARTRLADLDVSDEAIAELTRQRDAAAADVSRLALALSAERKASAAKLGAAVTSELDGLAMPGASLDVAVRARTSGQGVQTLDDLILGPDGADDIEFLLQPHPQAPALPIARGASGGELSRVMLALEVCLAGTDPVPTMVFDEVDSGVGGRAAVEVGRRLAQLARAHQVIVVTHLAQVAAYADRHIVLDKAVSAVSAVSAASADEATNGGVTTSDVRLVAGDDRVTELARMLAGTDSTAARKHAAELLETAAEHRAANSAQANGAPRRTARKRAKTPD